MLIDGDLAFDRCRLRLSRFDAAIYYSLRCVAFYLKMN